MALSDYITRITEYYSRHGLGATLHRLSLQAKRGLFCGRMVVFYFDLAEQSSTVAIPKSVEIHRLRSHLQLNAADMRDIVNFWNPIHALRNIHQRFESGASLWLIKEEQVLAGYGWSIRGHTVEPYYFSFSPDDVHLFDFLIFPAYRGRGLNPLLVRYILNTLAAEASGRAFIEVAEWNRQQLLSLGRTPFHCLGSVRAVKILGHMFSNWRGKGVAVVQSTSLSPTQDGRLN